MEANVGVRARVGMAMGGGRWADDNVIDGNESGEWKEGIGGVQ